MIEYSTGDIFSINIEALVNPVNCVGIMGKGLALEFKKRYPQNFAWYYKICSDNRLTPGKVLTTYVGLDTVDYIINFPTKRHWRDSSTIECISTGLDALLLEIKKLHIKSIALPALGCGNGKLLWSDVKPLMEARLSSSEFQAIVFEPI